MTVFVNFAPMVTGIGDCVRAGLAVDSIGGVPADMRVCLLVPSAQVPWDNCECGQLAQAVRRVYLSDTFPALAATHNQKNCGPQWLVAEVILSVARCAPGPAQNGDPPPCPDLLHAALVLESDRSAVLQYLSCCLRDLLNQHRLTAWAIGSSETVGDLGGCVATETTYFLGLRNCLCGGS